MKGANHIWHFEETRIFHPCCSGHLAVAVLGKPSSENGVVRVFAARKYPHRATPTFSPAPGTYTSSVVVTLSDTTPSATIHCTTDGSGFTDGVGIIVDGTQVGNYIQFTLNVAQAGTYDVKY